MDVSASILIPQMNKKTGEQEETEINFTSEVYNITTRVVKGSTETEFLLYCKENDIGFVVLDADECKLLDN